MWTFTCITFGTFLITKYLYGEIPQLMDSLTISTIRNFYGIVIAWMILKLEFGSWKWLGNFMSHKLWAPLGKLSFSLYLIHPVLQYTMMASRKQPIDFEKLQMVTICKIIWLFSNFDFLDSQLLWWFFHVVDFGNFFEYFCWRTVHTNWKNFS